MMTPNGLILAGGKSSRMGRDKSLLVFHDTPQRLHLFNLLKPLCSEVYLSCKRDENIPGQLNPLTDRFELDSPLNGILSAFKYQPDSAWLTVAVDMPFVDTPILKTLIENRNAGKLATCYYDSDGSRPEPLLTVWEPYAWPMLEDFYRRGGVSPRQFLMENPVHLLTVPNRIALVNVNTEKDANDARNLQAQKGKRP